MNGRFLRGVFSEIKNPMMNEKNELNEISGKPRNRQERRILKSVEKLLTPIDVTKHKFELDPRLFDDKTKQD